LLTLGQIFVHNAVDSEARALLHILEVAKKS